MHYISSPTHNSLRTIVRAASILTVSAALVFSFSAPVSTYAVVNEAEITSTTTFDPDTSNNVAQSADVPIGFVTDLEVVANVVTSPIYPGLPVEYNFVIKNNGPSTATSVVLIGYLPTGISTPTYTTPQGVTFNSSTGEVSGLNLLPNQSFTLTVNGTVVSTVEADITGTIKVSPPSGVTDNDLTNNEEAYTLDITPAADLSLAKTTTETSLTQGTVVKYTMVGTNNGPSTAQPNIVITDTLPTELSFDSVDTQASSNGWSCAAQTGQTVTCTNTNPIPNSESTTLVINVLVTGGTVN